MFFKTARSSNKLAYLNSTQNPLQFQWTGPAQPPQGLIKIADRIPLNTHDNFYLQNWAVSALEKWGYNDNFDAFEKKELLKSFRTFVGSWTCLDHENHSAHLAVGENIDAAYMPDDYVQIVMAVNRKKGESRRPGLEQKIASGQITDTSMGCLARESVCGACDHVAFDENQYCPHIAEKRGQKICDASTGWKEVIAFEKNRGVVFFEDSIITDSEGADRQAKILAKIAAFNPFNSVKSIPADKLYVLLRDMTKTASMDEKAFLIHLLDGVTRLMDEPSTS